MKHFMNKLLILLGFFLLLSGCSLIPKEEEPLEPPLVEPNDTEYETEKVESEQMVDAFEARGTFESDDEADITSPDEGQEVEEIHVESNDDVDKGDTLVELEVGDLPLDIRQQKLSVSEAELDLETAQKNANENEENDTELNQEVESSEIELEREQNELDDLQEKRDDAEMTAPISGVVTSLDDIKKGEEVEPDTTIATISDPDSLRLETSDDRSEWEDISSGMDVDVTIGDDELTGEVNDIPDEDSDNNLTVDVGDIPDSVDLGEHADMEIIFEEREDVLTVPPEAIRNYDEQAVVRILDDGDLSEVNVETGMELDDEIEIESGLDEGDEVVLR